MNTVFQVGPEGEALPITAEEAAENALDLTPAEIVAELDKHIIGQNDAKRAVAIALRNRRRRQKLPEGIRDEVIPKNILMIGPTGVGKTEIARRLANLSHAPFIKVEATKFTEVGYVGRDVDSMVRDLVQVSARLVEQEEVAKVKERAAEAAIDTVLNLLQPSATGHRPMEKFAQAMGEWFTKQQGKPSDSEAEEFDLHDDAGSEPEETDEYALKRAQQTERIRARLRSQLVAGDLDEREVEIEVDDSSNPLMQVFSPQGMEEMGMDLSGMLGGMMPKRKKTRKVTIAEAKEILAEQIAREMVDPDKIAREAIDRAEQAGIIFVDEMDKIAGRERGEGSGPSVSREGVQRDILPIIEGSTVMTKQGPVRTHHILFIAAGAFHVSKPSDLIPELQGRLPIRVELESLTCDDFKRILTEPKNALVTQYIALMSTEGITLEFSEEAVERLAEIAADVNTRTENIGARRLHTIMERLLEEISFEAPTLAEKHILIDAAYVDSRLAGLAKDEDLARYIL